MKWKRCVSKEELDTAESMTSRKMSRVKMESILRRIQSNPFNGDDSSCSLWMGNESSHVTLFGRTTYVRRALYTLFIREPHSDETVTNLDSCRGIYCCKLTHLRLKRRRSPDSSYASNVTAHKKKKSLVEDYLKLQVGHCRQNHSYKITLEETKRLLESIEGNFSDRRTCSIWMGPQCGAKVGGRYVSPARVVHDLFIGEVPKGRRVLRTCVNRNCCVNPSHLKLSSYSVREKR